MRKLIPLLCLVLFALTFPWPSAAYEVFDCVVTDVSETTQMATVICDTRNRSRKAECAPDSDDALCVHTTFDVPLDSWGEFSQWPKVPLKGQLLKATWSEHGFQTVASCQARAQRAPERDREVGLYKRDPINKTPLDVPNFDDLTDCHRPLSRFIRQLLVGARAQ